MIFIFIIKVIFNNNSYSINNNTSYYDLVIYEQIFIKIVVIVKIKD